MIKKKKINLKDNKNEGAPFSPSMERKRENNLPHHSLIHIVAPLRSQIFYLLLHQPESLFNLLGV